jgi:hypothetical protein
MLTSPVMTCPTGLYLKGDEEQEEVGGLNVRWSKSSHCKVFDFKKLDAMVGVYV